MDLFARFFGGALLVAASVAQEKPELRPGLVGEYFQMDSETVDFPAIGDRTPTLRRIDARVNFSPTDKEFAGSGLTDNFFVRWTGFIRIPKDATYVFFTWSDDGSRLFIDGTLVVDNGLLHDTVEERGRVTLTKGDHRIRIEFFECKHGAACRARWEADGIPKQNIPAGVLFHKKDGDLDKK